MKRFIQLNTQLIAQPHQIPPPSPKVSINLIPPDHTKNLVLYAILLAFNKIQYFTHFLFNKKTRLRC